jgi:hypothetical protein
MKAFLGAPTGRAHVTTMFMRPVIWGPHEVGGAEAGPQRHSKEFKWL